MANAKRDENRVPTLIAVSTIDNTTPVVLKASPSTGALEVNASVSITGVSTADNQTNGNQIVKVSNTLITVPFDYVGATYPDTSTEVYTYKTGGSGGTTVGTITVVYSDAGTKQIISSVTKS